LEAVLPKNTFRPLGVKLNFIKNSQIKKIHYMVIRFFCKIHSKR
jgi:hypothetical protein